MVKINKEVIINYLTMGLPYIGYLLIALLLFFAIIKYYKMLLTESGKIWEDTLKTDGKYTRTSVTMFSSFMIGSIYATYSLIKSGFDFNVFLVYMLIATGIKISDAYSKKIVGNVTPEEPKDINLKITNENTNNEVG